MFPGQRYELIQGELIDKMGQKPPHAYASAKLNEILASAFPARIRIQLPHLLPDPDGVYSEPEPDIVVLKAKTSNISIATPGRDESRIALINEVSDTTIRVGPLHE